MTIALSSGRRWKATVPKQETVEGTEKVRDRSGILLRSFDWPYRTPEISICKPLGVTQLTWFELSVHTAFGERAQGFSDIDHIQSMAGTA